MRENLIARLRKRWPNFDGLIIGIKYLRASHDASGRSISVASQDDEGDEFFDEHGIVNGGTFYDNNLSASTYATATRQDYEKALDELKSGRAHLMWTFDSSRAQRDLEVYVKLRRICIEAGALWAYGGRIYDMSDPADRKATARDAVEAEGASDTISTHVRRGIRKRARSGLHAGPLPFGYRRQFDPTTGEPLGQVIDPDQKAVVREIVERSLECEPLTSIANDFNARGVLCARDRRWDARLVKTLVTDRRSPREWELFEARLDAESVALAETLVARVEGGETPKELARELNRDGVPYFFPSQWNSTKVRKIALSDAAAGIRIHQGEQAVEKVPNGRGGFEMVPVKVTWEPIISEQEHTLLKARFADPQRKTLKDGTRARHLWTGIARCGECDGRLAPRRMRQGERYRCQKGCVVRPKDKLEAWLTEQAMQLLERPDAARVLRLKDQAGDAHKAHEEARVLRSELAAWRADASAGKVTRASFAAIEPGLVERIEKADAKAKQAALPPILSEVVGPDARMVFKALSIAKKREVLRAIMRPRIYHINRPKVLTLETDTIDPGFLHLRNNVQRAQEPLGDLEPTG